MRRRIAVLLLAGLPVPLAALGQEPATRTEALAHQRDEKAAHLRPPEPTLLERTLIALEQDRVLERILHPAEGFYPKLGNITPGSGFAAGVGYRKPGLLGERADFMAFASASMDRYWMLDATLLFPRLARERAFALVRAQRYDFPLEDFFGLGPGSARDAFVLYRETGSLVGAGAGVRPLDQFTLSGRIDYMAPRLSSAPEGPGIAQRFDEEHAPGLARQPDFLRTEVVADLNSRSPHGNPRRGSRVVLTFQQFADRDFARYSFRRFEADVQQYIPFVNDRRVIALHGLLSLSTPDAHQVPFYLQRTLGGPDDLRGFRRFRFRDENILLLQAEYRWEIFTAVDGALFYDAGTVAPTRSSLSLDRLESNYGVGFRFGTINGVFLRVEGAFGSRDGKHFVLRYGHVF